METVKQTVLIVDDSPVNISIIRRMLESDYEIQYATSGEEALSLVMVNHVDLILLDVMMPGLDGFEVCKKLKSQPFTKNIPIIFVSGMCDVEDEKKGLEAGAIDYIFKPFHTTIVKMRVKNHLELKKYRDLLENLSLRDGLTGIANRRYFDEVYSKAWQRALCKGEALGVLLLDIDFFKHYNDYYGHLQGDDCLRLVAGALSNSIKGSKGLVARYGGEEFVVLLPSTTLEEALDIGEKMRKNVQSLKIFHEASGVCEYVTLSIGVAVMKPDKDLAARSLLEKADHGLYQAKNKGRNQIHC
ncbi:diguanylate cyclase domain-containing protein [Pelosinus propionicus]|uniref:Diguanylate cyclase (GGDEF) domain-containing protein n=1 Tax=Pelosinus propionicus DSM 13327 TaxID=1123291 RepID=A0A1I4M2X4_9FIRM|nr:diguanylate cyclase [Pelosinus propionicus]SFL97550.1 diguanylate cyclase (GGDEF) domain-containing protein [Pelosinus propionicus DSM 13327]